MLVYQMDEPEFEKFTHRKSCQGSTYLFKALSWKVIRLQPYFGWLMMKICENFDKISPPVGKCISHNWWKQIHCLKLYIFIPKQDLFLFEFSNNNRIKCETCSKLTVEATDVVLVPSLLTVNIVDTFLVFFAEFEYVNAGWNTLLR